MVKSSNRFAPVWNIFGAGNLIFPPSLGVSSGEQFFLPLQVLSFQAFALLFDSHDNPST